MVNSNGFIWTCGWITGTKNSCNENFWSLNSRIVKCCRSDRRNKPFRPPNILCCRKYIWFSTGMTQKANNISLIYFASLVILKWSKRKRTDVKLNLNKKRFKKWLQLELKSYYKVIFIWMFSYVFFKLPH